MDSACENGRSYPAIAAVGRAALLWRSPRASALRADRLPLGRQGRQGAVSPTRRRRPRRRADARSAGWRLRRRSRRLPYATQIAMTAQSRHALHCATTAVRRARRARDLLSQARHSLQRARTRRTDAAAKEALRDLIGTPEVPVLLVGRSKLKGFDEDAGRIPRSTAGIRARGCPGSPPPRRRPRNAAPPAVPAEPPTNR